MIDFSKVNIVGLTGMSGAGKSTASEFLKKRGFYVIDCDTEARSVINCSPCIDEVRAAFPDVFTDGIFGTLDRKKAAQFLFSDSKRLKEYQNIVFPYVVFSIIDVINKSDAGCILLDAPTLFQSGVDDFCSSIVAVIADVDVCVNRVTERDNINMQDALMRLNNQPNADFFQKNADYIIENNSSFDEFVSKINQLEI